MVQVDVFWSYGIGAGLGLASAAKGAAKGRLVDLVKTPGAFQTLLFLAVVFAPSGFVLLWSFPSWETMHVGTRELPPWLVALFGVTNISQGLLGYAVARWLTAQGRPFAAYLHWVGGYFGMFFILVHGWDGTGYQRFLSPDAASLEGWTWATGRAWLTSDVALTLMAMGVVLIPWLVGLTVAWLREGMRARGQAPRGVAALSASMLGLLVVALPALAVVASLLVRGLGAVGGCVATAALFVLLASRVGPLRWHFHRLGFEWTGSTQPAAQLVSEAS